MKKLPLGIQTFSKIVEGNYVYVDKTQYIYNLVNDFNCCFLSRPRRFGKSLLLDTIAEVFKGNKALFEGLWIYDSDYAFQPYPVIRLDMGGIDNETPTALKRSIAVDIKRYIKTEGFDITGKNPLDILKLLIEALSEKYNQRVVVLIDEYDKPILDHLGSLNEAEANRNVLRGFFGVLKSMDPYLRFVMFTGVSKFTKTSVFSGLNQVTDITMKEKYANICGVSVDDLDQYFGDHIRNLLTLKKFQLYENLHDEILAWYDGYSWDGETRVLNPWSLLSFFDHEKFSNFWYASGSPKFLMDLIREKPAAYTTLKNYELTEIMLDSVDIANISIEPLLFQTGYLTVKEIIDSASDTVYIADMPNHEVRSAFNLHTLSALTANSDAQAYHMQSDIKKALQNGDLQKTLALLRSLFASIPYELHIGREAYYHSVFYAVMNVLGFEMEAEVSVSQGRIDAMLELADKVYILEFKYSDCEPDVSAEEKQKLFAAALKKGMEQIKAKGYSRRYAGSGKTIYQAAYAFLGRDDIEMLVERL